MRAMAVRMRRYDSRTALRKSAVTSPMNGSTENVSNASFQLMLSITTMMLTSEKMSPKMATMTGGEELVEDVDVGRHPRHQAPDRVAVKEAQVQPLQVRKDFLAQVVHHALPDELHREGLRELQQEGYERRGQKEQQGDLNNAGARVGAEDPAEDGRGFGAARRVEISVHEQLDEVGRYRLEDAVEDDRHERQEHHQPVGPQIASSRRISRASYALPRTSSSWKLSAINES